MAPFDNGRSLVVGTELLIPKNITDNLKWVWAGVNVT